MSVDNQYDIELNFQGLALHTGSEVRRSFETLYETPRELATTEGEGTRHPFWWRKRYSDMAGGYDQRYAESRESEVNRFFDSSGIDVSTPGEVRLMNSMTASLAKSGTNGYLLARKGKLILTDGVNVNHYTTAGGWVEDVDTGVTGSIQAQTSDGNLYYVTGSSGNMRRTADWTTWLDHSTSGDGDNSTDLAINNNQLYGVEGQKFYKINSGATANTELFDIGNDAWTLNSIVEHNKNLAFSAWRGTAGGEKSYVYESDGTAAGTKLLVDDLPLGFKVYKIHSYSDILFIIGGSEITASAKGVGMVYAYTNSILTFLGRLNETAQVGFNNPSVAATLDTIPRVVFGHGQYVYFGMNEGSGLWRYDIKYGGISRSWSAAAGTNVVTGAATFAGNLYVAYSGAGAFVETTSFVSSGWITMSATTMDSGNPKVGRKVLVGGKTDVTVASHAETDDTGYDLYNDGTNDYQRAQTFLTTSAGKLKEVIVEISSAATVRDEWLKCELRNVSASLPGETIYDTATLYAPDVSSANEVVFEFGSDYQLADATNYALVFSSNAPTAARAYNVRAVASGGYGSGQACVSTGLTESWSAVAGADIPFVVIASKTNASSEIAPFAVEVSKDVGSTWLTLKKNDTYGKEFLLRNNKKWDTVMTKITISDSDVVLQDVTIEAVPVLSNDKRWSLMCDLNDPIRLVDGTNKTINPQVVWENLEAARTGQVPVPYRDQDYDKATTKKIYMVLVEHLSSGPMVIDGKTIQGLAEVRLREF